TSSMPRRGKMTLATGWPGRADSTVDLAPGGSLTSRAQLSLACSRSLAPRMYRQPAPAVIRRPAVISSIPTPRIIAKPRCTLVAVNGVLSGRGASRRAVRRRTERSCSDPAAASLDTWGSADLLSSRGARYHKHLTRHALRPVGPELPRAAARAGRDAPSPARGNLAAECPPD